MSLVDLDRCDCSCHEDDYTMHMMACCYRCLTCEQDRIPPRLFGNKDECLACEKKHSDNPGSSEGT